MAKWKKRTIFLSAAVVLLAVCATVFFFCRSEKSEMPVMGGMANWTNQAETFSEACDASVLIVTGTVVSIDSYENSGVVFSTVTADVVDTFQGPSLEQVAIRFSAGIIDGTIHTIYPLKLPDEGETYLFLLKETEKENLYLPVGGYQGMFLLDGQAVKTRQAGREEALIVQPFNEENRLEAEIRGKDIFTLLESIENEG